MLPLSAYTVVIMLLLPGGEPPENPWKEKVAPAVARADSRPTVAALHDALDVAWRADDWEAGLKMAELALRRHADEPELLGMIVRGLWRGGRIADAEHLATKITPDRKDRVALRVGLELSLTRGELARAEKLAARLEDLKPHTAEDLYQLFGLRLMSNRLTGAADMLRQAERLTDPNEGYPETYVAEAINGVADFLEAVGPQPLNQIEKHGSAPMPPLVLLNLPSCDAYINGRGPFRLIVDTGGSITLALDQTVADEIGLKSVATATIRGVSGKQESGQVLVEELRIGDIVCRRVVTRTFDVHGAIMNAADGIIGTGVFWGGRMTLDFARGELVIGPSQDEPGPGRAAELRLVSDAKLVVPVTLEGQPGVALLDTGADAVALAPSRLKKLFPDREVEIFAPGLALGVGSGKGPEISLGRGVKLEFAGRTFENYGGLGLDVLDDVLSPVMGIQTDILLGMPTFREMKSCTVDFPKCRMWIEWMESK